MPTLRVVASSQPLTSTLPRALSKYMRRQITGTKSYGNDSLSLSIANYDLFLFFILMPLVYEEPCPCIQNALRFPSSNKPLSIITNYNWQVAMPQTFRLFSIRHTTTIILVDSNLNNLNMIQGDLRHMDWSTSITNRDAFNVELASTVTEQLLPSTTSVTSLGKVVIGS
jgi:hypothetical protein